MTVDTAKLAKLQAAAKLSKGTGPRRVAARKGPRNVVDDQKLSAALKKIGVTPMPGIEEVNMFKADGNVIHFNNVKVHAAQSSNTFATYGQGQDKELTELVPGILNQLGPDSLNNLRKMAESYHNLNAAQQASALAGQNATAATAEEGDDDEVPELTENFDETAKIQEIN